MIDRTVRIGTRPSELALRRARMVQAALETRGAACELVTIKTGGDKRATKTLTDAGAKGLYTHELEVALARDKVDCCVHSLKDLPTELREGLVLAAVLEREDPRDVLVVNPVTQAEDLATLPAGSRVGTSSLRRRAQVLATRSDLEVVELRGNVPTRLRKVERGQVHAGIFSAADLIRLEAVQRIAQFLEAPGWLPAAGQGVVAVEVRADDDEMRALVGSLDHRLTALATSAERAFLAGLDAGNQMPIGALALRTLDGELILHGLVSDVRGHEVVRGSIPVEEAAPERSGRALAADLRTRGAASLLMALRNASPF